ncbi:MAG TPA: CidA/LrgA family protein [Myxococcaceae bacterium]|nr:CidA/LrgA family protein [Myxococcaceae bacterium]
MIWVRTGLQLVVLGALVAACQWLVARTGIPVPAGLLALLVLIALLLTRVVPERAVDKGGDLLLRFLPVIFLPPSVGVFRELHLVDGHGVTLALVLLASLVVGQVVAGLVAQVLVDREKR